MIIILFLLLGTSIVYSARQPIVDNDNNQWGAILNEYLNVSHTESGALRKGLNVSFYDINITGKTNITSNVNMYNLTLTDKITFALGEIIDNLIDGWIKITGGLQVSGDITANSLNGSWNESGNLKTELRGSIDANITEVNSRVLNTSTSFGGGVSGSFNSIVLGNDALDDQYYDSESDLTGLLNDNYIDVSGDTMAGNLIINGNLTIIGGYVEANVTNMNINGSVLPELNNLFDLGSSTLRWANGYFATIYGALEGAFNNANFTSNYETRTDRYADINFSNSLALRTNLTYANNLTNYIKNGTGILNVSDRIYTTTINSTNSNLTFFINGASIKFAYNGSHFGWVS